MLDGSLGEALAQFDDDLDGDLHLIHADILEAAVGIATALGVTPSDLVSTVEVD